MSILIETATLVDDTAVPLEAERLEITQNLIAGAGIVRSGSSSQQVFKNALVYL